MYNIITLYTLPQFLALLAMSANGSLVSSGATAETFVLDLEFSGPRQRCAVYEIAMIRTSDGEAFHRFVRYDTEAYVACHGAPVIAPEFLQDNDAQDPQDVARDLVAWMPEQALIYGHDCFRNDQPILETFLETHAPEQPVQWMFSDTLLHARLNVRMRSYRMESLAQALLPTSHRFQHEFSALQDARTLRHLLPMLGVSTNPGTFAVPWKSCSVRVVPGIGFRAETSLRFQYNVKTMAELLDWAVASPQRCMRAVRPDAYEWIMDAIERHRQRMRWVQDRQDAEDSKEQSSLQCPECGSGHIRVEDRQRRRADEGMDTYVICLDCGCKRMNE